MEDIINRIHFIKTQNGHDIDLSTFQIIEGEMCINGVRISRKNTCKICYTCQGCGKQNIIRLPLFVRKVYKNSLTCKHCRDYISLEENEWEGCDEFKFEYYKKQLTLDEFERIKHLIISFQHDKFNDISKFIYRPIVKIDHQKKHVPLLYDIERHVYEEIRNIVFKCEKCTNLFVCQELSLQKNKYKIWCKSCTHPKKTLNIHSTKNVNGDVIYYRNTYELTFLLKMAKHGILVKNDESVPFCFVIPNFSRRVEIRHKKKYGEQPSNHYIVYSKTMDLQIDILIDILKELKLLCNLNE